jgi:hypothetical protein
MQLWLDGDTPTGREQAQTSQVTNLSGTPLVKARLLEYLGSCLGVDRR